ncbi:bifunctional [glutamine synthetase] adenylyltransferase/[glutamine synthetase]-adenylyl-L-tyrosine phosphorylase [Devosia sp. MC521]|uniref:bifunctional [glutamine synthetase] adenylyltransferase/[glutamine synthetase]-adenylyl-L-tyrosine phosphorylase n=1 Tax=Devosia sp. MC521 TaxID=2759954 RepID=UPI0015FD42D5|nr:bifunctional [glutamine synthetase] adenylyltransferase/[glutamine synthetase]-adenylyl-L-tyrosine phosphorylase [Devosia sp. MC521]MBJ6987326.1 bifunctional [glutamine synthetase] adenylyltransferase/[glutamine synthetase]-adenylyl-L-tyrosine phosphorylase [Devosia sp. MC521]QMW63502.1 bifunctional [glutamine synthetase] adenylyltransferase/[glutamine synthetase]-adenylyl-L-tyrosine phosphorylase [Devosia sp. MC521]
MLSPLPAVAHPQFDAFLAELEHGDASVFSANAVAIGPLLEQAPYLLDLARKNASWLATALSGDADASFAALLADVATAGQTSDENELMVSLRRAKGQTALLAAVAEVGKLWTTARSTEALSDLADAALEAGLDFLMRQAAEKGRLTIPLDEACAANSGLALFALGKHGGRELNYSSDIDIVAFFDPHKAVLADPSEATKLYSRMVQKLVSIMQDQQLGGYVFRTDLRLRPDPGSTPVALSVDSAMAYYEVRGQNWERAAWIKARPCAGDKQVGDAFIKDLAPYIWRKHLDFATIADIQAMKRQINVSKKVGDIRVEGHNVKLGRGGIREIEFFAQTQQLIAGGRDKSLRVRPTSYALAALAEANWISPRTAKELTDTYWYLRAIENRLQMLRDEQTHIMPDTPEDVAVIGRLMGEPDLKTFEASYRAALERVARYYAELFTEGETLGSGEGNLVFTGSDDDPGTLETLTNMGFADAHKAIETVRKWHYGSYAATRSSVSRAHLTELLPSLLVTLGRAGNADEALARMDNFLSRLPGGVQLFALLRNHEQLRTLLVQFMASAPRMAEAVIHRAHVVDGLIDPAFANDVTHRDVLVGKVDAFLADARSYEELIDRARIIGQEQKFLIAAGLLSGTVSAAGAGEQFTALAETLLHRLFEKVQDEFAVRHGRIPGADVAILAFGKMASREMTYASDLDFFLLYDAPEIESDGERPLSASHYFARLTQRLVSAVSAPTSEGVLYEADMRLRPSGNAGPLASSLAGFKAYHKDNAWTWEHLALSRARVVSASGELKKRLHAEMDEIMARPRDVQKTIDDVVTMRELMARERKPRHAFDLKLANGGLVDLEFIAQSAQLVAFNQIALPGAQTGRVLARLGEIGLVPEGARLAEILSVYATILQVMSSALMSPFQEEAWSPAFKDLLAQLVHYPSFAMLATDIADMQGEVAAAAAAWYERANAL